jgi:hypothetical protein
MSPRAKGAANLESVGDTIREMSPFAGGNDAEFASILSEGLGRSLYLYLVVSILAADPSAEEEDGN